MLCRDRLHYADKDIIKGRVYMLYERLTFFKWVVSSWIFEELLISLKYTT